MDLIAGVLLLGGAYGIMEIAVSRVLKRIDEKSLKIDDGFWHIKNHLDPAKPRKIDRLVALLRKEFIDAPTKAYQVQGHALLTKEFSDAPVEINIDYAEAVFGSWVDTMSQSQSDMLFKFYYQTSRNKDDLDKISKDVTNAKWKAIATKAIRDAPPKLKKYFEALEALDKTTFQVRIMEVCTEAGLAC